MTSETKSTSGYLHLRELMASPEYQHLANAAQRFFIIEYVSLGIATGTYDAVKAAAIAYPRCKTPKLLSYQLMSKRCIRKVLALHWHRSAIDEVILDLQRLIKQARRRGSNTGILLPDLKRVASALEASIAKGQVDGKS
jgi:hypothetical protein